MRSRRNGYMIVVSYPWFGLAFLVAFGFIMLVCSWSLEDPYPQESWNEVAVVGFGIAFIVIGLWKLSGPRVGFVVDRHGIWLPGWFNEHNLKLIPWADLAAVRLVSCHNNCDSEHDYVALLLQLRPGAENLRRRNCPARYKRAIERESSPLDWSCTLPLVDPGWQWSPKRVVRMIDKCIKDPTRRDRLSSYAPRGDSVQARNPQS
jgi:hypothetical protein